MEIILMSSVYILVKKYLGLPVKYTTLSNAMNLYQFPTFKNFIQATLIDSLFVVNYLINVSELFLKRPICIYIR